MNKRTDFFFLVVFCLISVIGEDSRASSGRTSGNLQTDLLGAVGCYMKLHRLPSGREQLVFEGENIPTIDEYERGQKEYDRLNKLYYTAQRKKLPKEDFMTMFFGLLDLARIGHKNALSHFKTIFEKGRLGFEVNKEYAAAFGDAAHRTSWETAVFYIMDGRLADYRDLFSKLRPPKPQAIPKVEEAALDMADVVLTEGRPRGPSVASTDVSDEGEGSALLTGGLRRRK